MAALLMEFIPHNGVAYEVTTLNQFGLHIRSTDSKMSLACALNYSDGHVESK